MTFVAVNKQNIANNIARIGANFDAFLSKNPDLEKEIRANVLLFLAQSVEDCSFKEFKVKGLDFSDIEHPIWDMDLFQETSQKHVEHIQHLAISQAIKALSDKKDLLDMFGKTPSVRMHEKVYQNAVEMLQSVGYTVMDRCIEIYEFKEKSLLTTKVIDQNTDLNYCVDVRSGKEKVFDSNGDEHSILKTSVWFPEEKEELVINFLNDHGLTNIVKNEGIQPLIPSYKDLIDLEKIKSIQKEFKNRKRNPDEDGLSM